MDKIIKNKYIWNLIVSNISKLNEGFVRYNYYDIPLEIVIKSRNQQLFKEKLENYNNYYLNDSGDGQDNFKYFININEIVFIELFKWKELSMQLFDLFFQLFKQEMVSTEFKYKLLNVTPSNYLGKTPLYKYLMEGCDINKLEYLYDNEWIDESMFQRISNFLTIDENKKKIKYMVKETPFKSYVLVNNLNFKQPVDISIIFSNNIRMYNLLINKMKINLPITTIYNLLSTIMENKQEQLQQRNKEGVEMYEKLSKMYIDLLPDELPLNNSKSIYYYQNYTASLMGSIIEFGDMDMLVLLLNKYKYNGPESKDVHTIYGIEVHKETMNFFDIRLSVFSSKFLELIVYLVQNKPTLFGILEIENIEFQIHDPEIVCYLVENLIIPNRYYLNLKLSPMCCHLLTGMGKRNKIKLDTSRKWSVPNSYHDMVNHITIDFINNFTRLDNSSILLDDIIKIGDFKLVSEFTKIYSKRFTIENSTLILASQLQNNTTNNNNNNNLILSFLLDLLIESNSNYYSSSEHFLTTRGYLISLLVYSIKYNQRLLFESAIILIKKLDDQHIPNIEIQFSYYDNELWEYNKENPKIVIGWLKGSGLQNEYFKVINSNISSLINNHSCQNYSSLKIVDSYYLIGEITSLNSQPQKILGYQSLKSIQYNILSMAANIGIVFTNASNHHSSSQYGLSNDNTLKSIYKSKGFLKNLLNPNYKPPYRISRFEKNPYINYYQNQKDKSIVINNVLVKLFKLGFLTIIDLDTIIHYSLKLSNLTALDLLLANGIYKNVDINSFSLFYPPHYHPKYNRNQFLNFLNYKIEISKKKKINNNTQNDNNLIIEGVDKLVF